MRNILGGLRFHQIRVFVPKRQDATRFASDDGIAILDEPMQAGDVELGISARGVGKTLGNHRTPAAGALTKINPIPGRLQNFNRRNTDLRVIKVDECVVKQNDLSGDRGFRILPFRVPGIEPGLQRLRRELRQLAPQVDAGKAFKGPPDSWLSETPVRNGRER